MNIFDTLKGHKVVEANNLQGLRTGHMIAQAKFDVEGFTAHEAGGLDNGFILALDEKNELVVANSEAGEAAGTGQAYLHYSEEHMKFLDNAPLEMFTVPVGEGIDAYPRAIALYDGDTFTTDNYDGDAPAAGYANVTVVDGLLTVASGAAAGAGPIAKKATLPNGKAAIEVVWRGGAL